METYMVFDLCTSSHPFLRQDTSDCTLPSPFSHDSDGTTTSQSWYCHVNGFQDVGFSTRSHNLLVEAHDEASKAEFQPFIIRGAISPVPPYFGSQLQRPFRLPVFCEGLDMDDRICSDNTVTGLLPTLFAPSHEPFLCGQPPSPPLDTPELVQRSLPAADDLPSAPSTLPLSTRDLSDACDVDMFDTEGRERPRPSSSRVCQLGEAGSDPSYGHICSWPITVNSTQEDASSPGSSTSTTIFHQLELLTPVTPTISWMPAPPSYPDEPMEYVDEFPYAENLSDWNGSSDSSLYDDLPRASRHRSRSLELPRTHGFRSLSPVGSSHPQLLRAHTNPAGLSSHAQDLDLDPLWTMDVDDATAPHSPCPQFALLPEHNLHSDSREERAPFHVDPPPLAISRRDSLSLPDLFDGDLLISPGSPRAFTTRLPELEMDDFLEPPSSPHSPYRELLPTDDDHASIPPPTVSPALLCPSQSGEGLGLFIQVSSIDPPLARSPSPDEDDMGFLDVQLDPASSPLQLDEFLSLRALRRAILDAERDARKAEAELSERVSLASEPLLPGNCSSDPEEKRAHKHELHVAMELRAEARKERKQMKQRNKEIGALLDLKMRRNVPYGKSSMRSVAQLVANMVLKRRDVYRPLANRKPASAVPSHPRSPLRASFCAHDLLENTDAD